MKKIINDPKNFVPEMLEGIYAGAVEEGVGGVGVQLGVAVGGHGAPLPEPHPQHSNTCTQ